MTNNRFHKFQIKSDSFIINNETLEIFHDDKFPPAGHSDPAGFLLNDKKISIINYNITDACNLICSYCWINDKPAHHITKDLVTKSLSAFSKRGLLAEKLEIHLFGGEPLLNFKAIRDVVAGSHEIYPQKDVKFTLFTNGTILTREMESFFIEHSFQIQISLDGPAYIQNTQRPFRNGTPSYDVVIANINRLLKILPYNIRISTTIRPDDYTFNYWDVCKHLFNIGSDNFSINICNGVPKPGIYIDSKYSEYLIRNIEDAALAYLERIKHGQFANILGFTRIIALLYSRVKKQFPFFNGIIPCVCTNGDVYPWSEVANIPSFCLGNVHSNINLDRLFEISESLYVDNIKSCKNCWARYLCGGYNYPFSIHHEHGLINPLQSICDFSKKEIELGAMIFYFLNKDYPYHLKQLLAFHTIKKHLSR